MTHTRPEFGTDRIDIGNHQVDIREEIAVDPRSGAWCVRDVTYCKD